MAGHLFAAADNLSNGRIETIDCIEEITKKRPMFYKLDVTDKQLDSLFTEHRFDSVLHFAALKPVAESLSNPMGHYTHNVVNTLQLIRTSLRYAVMKYMFSSSVTV